MIKHTLCASKGDLPRQQFVGSFQRSDEKCLKCPSAEYSLSANNLDRVFIAWGTVCSLCMCIHFPLLIYRITNRLLFIHLFIIKVSYQSLFSTHYGHLLYMGTFQRAQCERLSPWREQDKVMYTLEFTATIVAYTFLWFCNSKLIRRFSSLAGVRSVSKWETLKLWKAVHSKLWR